MTVYDFCNLCTDDAHEVAIYDFTKEREVLRGSMRDAMFCDYADDEVLSFDLDPWGGKDTGVYLVLNIETEESEDEYEDECEKYSEPPYSVVLVSEGGTRVHWASFMTEEEAEEEAERNCWQWVDGNGFCWSMEIEENW